MVKRPAALARLRRLLETHPVVALLGARQVGKSTLARDLVRQAHRTATFFDLEDPTDLARLDDPKTALAPLRGVVVLDEIRRRPDLFPVLRVLADRPRRPARFLVLGSASPELLRQSSETLAGRIAFQELTGFTLDEVGPDRLDRLWLRGGFPRSFLARSDTASMAWRHDFVRTFLERDLPQIGINVGAITMHRFWSMIAHYHGQLWNSSELARSFAVSDTTTRRWVDLLAATFMVRLMSPWSANVGKRQVKTSRVYVTDSGLLHALLGIDSRAALERHPKLGASWEGFGIEALIRHLGARREEAFFWRTHTGAELDLLIVRGRTRIGFEIKRTVAPSVTPSMRSALADLELARIDVVHAGDATYPLAPKIRAVALSRLLTDVEPLSGR
ncbi:MAG: ATP-binding protein [Deltaproteobacteria bacterium]|nr:ATP-binding protein [Deltaproteobacteria bacterium]